MSRRATRSSGQALAPLNNYINRRPYVPYVVNENNENGESDINVRELLESLNVKFTPSPDAGYVGCLPGPNHAMRIEMTATNLEMPKSRVQKVLSEYLKLTAAQIRTTKCARIPKIGVVGARVRSYMGEQKYRAGLRAPVLSHQLQNKLTRQKYSLPRSEETIKNMRKKNKEIAKYTKRKSLYKKKQKKALKAKNRVQTTL